MATYNPSNAYLESKILSASPLELVCLAYEETIEAIRLARTCVVERRIQDRSQAITKAQLLIGELQSSLDFNLGGQLSQQLSGLYRYMQSRLIEANFTQSEEALAEVETLLGTVLESWRELALQDKSAPANAAANPLSSSSPYSPPEPTPYSSPETAAYSSSDSSASYASYSTSGSSSYASPDPAPYASYASSDTGATYTSLDSTPYSSLGSSPYASARYASAWMPAVDAPDYSPADLTL